MKVNPTLLLMALPVSLISFIGALFWLSISMILQVIVDKIFAQKPMDAYGIVGLALIVPVFLGSCFEVGLDSVISIVARSQGAPRESLLQLSAVFPRVILIVTVLAVYSPLIAAITVGLTAIACATSLLLKRSRIGGFSRPYPLPLSFRLPFTLVVLIVLWCGGYLVLAEQFTVGQWMATGILSLQFAAVVLSFTALAVGERQYSRGL